MDTVEEQALRAELEQFKKEKEQIRAIIGRIGGVGSVRRDRIINSIFIIVIVLLFAIDMFRHLMGFPVPFPPLFSLELGILLISIKIIWMIHKNTKVDHFQFWIMSSIEFRINDLAKKVNRIEERIEKATDNKST
jgi:hypothetical protein